MGLGDLGRAASQFGKLDQFGLKTGNDLVLYAAQFVLLLLHHREPGAHVLGGVLKGRLDEFGEPGAPLRDRVAELLFDRRGCARPHCPFRSPE